QGASEPTTIRFPRTAAGWPPSFFVPAKGPGFRLRHPERDGNMAKAPAVMFQSSKSANGL
ncbi:hypothetical protein, partial [Mesorhizobium sp. M7A.F.Ca.CA.001.16.1.1]|uniref:hypothetical protein n=1 Tax=Mesorhizobium sp. M7A.F.Ca.CA.001.16.1.1 TaxID=2496683 RepID=UPI0019D4EC1B